VLTNQGHDRQWFNRLIPPSHESPVVSVAASVHFQQVLGGQWKHVVGS